MFAAAGLLSNTENFRAGHFRLATVIHKLNLLFAGVITKSSPRPKSPDKARRGAVHLSFWLTAALLFGAFAASLAAAEGGALRDGTWNDRVLMPRAI